LFNYWFGAFVFNLSNTPNKKLSHSEECFKNGNPFNDTNTTCWNCWKKEGWKGNRGNDL